jgi:chromate transporter
MPDRPRGALREVALLFLRLGATAFGGPAAHIAVLEDEAVRRRRWLSREEFLDLLGATNLIPGPNSTEMAIHLGLRRAGGAGLVVAGAAFIVPAAGMTLLLAWAYVRFGTRPEAAGLLYGVKPVAIAIIAQALWGLGRTAARTGFLVAVTAVAVAASALGVDELALLLAAGLAAVAEQQARAGRQRGLPALATLGAPAASLAAPFGLPALFLFFLKVGAVLFGSGYVLLAFLRTDLVERFHWLTESQLLDAVAAGQVTPGPVFSTATFVGYVLGGLPGAALATLGIFLPAFAFVAASGPLVPRLRRSPAAGAFLDGVNAGALALMMAVTWQLGRAAVVDVPTAVVAVASGVLLVRLRVNSAWLLVGGGVVGLVLRAIG